MPDRRWKAADVRVDRWYLLTFRAVSHLHEMPRQGAFIDGVLERVGALPGVESVAMRRSRDYGTLRAVSSTTRSSSRLPTAASACSN